MADINGAKTTNDLEAEHRRLDALVDALSKRPYLTQAEQIEHAILKKRRLQMRDALFSRPRTAT